MNEKLNFILIGGDIRLIGTANRLLQAGHNVSAAGFEKNKDADGRIKFLTSVSDAAEKNEFVILPLPVTVDGVHIKETDIKLLDLFSSLKKTNTVFGGMIGGKTYVMSPYTIIDYFKKEEMILRNAYLTAEGAVSYIIGSCGKSLRETKILITGYGRIAKFLTQLLKPMCPDITVCARKKNARLWIEENGLKSISFDDLSDLSGFDIMVNTVPENVLSNRILDTVRENAVIFELASKPYGFDTDYAEKKKIRFNILSSLPSKTAYLSAGAIIADTVIDIINERRNYES